MKNRYHPILKQKYFLGVLSDREISLIKPRTFYSWSQVVQNELVGYDPDDPLIAEREIFSFVHNYKHARKLLKAYMGLFSCFRTLLKSAEGFNERLRVNKTLIIEVYRKSRNFITAKKFEILTGISPKKISRWENEINCENSFLQVCKLKSPAQLTFAEQVIVTESLYDRDHEHLFICDVWAKLVRTGKLLCKLPTFYKYSRLAIRKCGYRNRKIKKPVHSIIAKAPLSVLHMDCTEIRTDDGGKWYLNIIYDNFSKAILGIKALLKPNSAEVALNLNEVIKKYDLDNKSFALYCDGGPENKKHVDELLEKYPKIRKLVTSFSSGIHNNMIESYNSKFKRKHILFLDLSKHADVPKQLESLQSTFNNSPQALIGTLTPNEVLIGMKPWESIWPVIENKIEIARQDRIKTNQLSCCSIQAKE